jgi:hypothetical protein
MSYKYFFVSRGIQERLGLLDGLAEVGIFDRGGDNQIHRATKKRLQSFQKTEISVRISARRWRIELNEKIKIAFARPILTRCGGSEQLQTPHMVAAAKRSEFRPVLGRKGYHGVFSLFKRIAQRRARFSLIVQSGLGS